MKAIIKKVVKGTGQTLFRVYSEDSCVTSHFFIDAQSEKKALEEAMKVAKMIEEIIPSEVVIYETPEIKMPR